MNNRVYLYPEVNTVNNRLQLKMQAEANVMSNRV